MIGEGRRRCVFTSTHVNVYDRRREDTASALKISSATGNCIMKAIRIIFMNGDNHPVC